MIEAHRWGGLSEETRAELADREQWREERRALCVQELRERHTRLELERREREIRLIHSAWRERILIAMSVVCLLGAVGLPLAG
ncbi:MAG: hypothetical protein M3335_02005 [Actinomycetota bacterium]|nr:hypothetical protein [Actinomycetota bacterium]